VALNTIDHNGNLKSCIIFYNDIIFLIGREGDSLRVIDEKALQEAKRWRNMSISEKIRDFTARRQYSLIIGGWATSLGVAAAIISRNKYQTFPQKVLTLIYCWVS
jgi:hypothetical protein